MSDEEAPPQQAGCAHCWPDSAEAAWGARSVLAQETRLIDESHFIVRVLTCLRCSQRFVSVFTEMIDWEAGEDPQSWSLLPITATEAANLLEDGSSLTEARLNSLGPGRRCLRHDNPKSGGPRLFWGTGLFVGMHD
jgi:hypothetical protein